MSRKDYKKFAATLKELRKTVNANASDPQFCEAIAYNAALDDVASDMCYIFSNDNAKFNKDKFLTAAEVQP